LHFRSKIERPATRKSSRKRLRFGAQFFAVSGTPGPKMRSEIDVLESKNGPKTELEVEKTKFGRHAEFIGPANQNQGSGLTKTDENRRKSRQKGDWKTTLHLEAFFCRFFGIFADSGRFWGLLGGPWGGIFGVFCVANFCRIFGRILEAGAAVPRWLL
jgi:hypothetical protein